MYMVTLKTVESDFYFIASEINILRYSQHKDYLVDGTFFQVNIKDKDGRVHNFEANLKEDWSLKELIVDGVPVVTSKIVLEERLNYENLNSVNCN